MNKEERTKRFKSMSSVQRQELILKKMKEKGIEVGSGIPNKKYESKDCLLYTSPSPRDRTRSRMPSSA